MRRENYHSSSVTISHIAQDGTNLTHTFSYRRGGKGGDGGDLPAGIELRRRSHSRDYCKGGGGFSGSINWGGGGGGGAAQRLDGNRPNAAVGHGAKDSRGGGETTSVRGVNLDLAGGAGGQWRGEF